MEEKALEYLERNSLFHTGMIFVIKRRSADIIHADEDGVFMKDISSGAYMLSFGNLDKAIDLLDSIGRQDLFCVYQKELSDYLQIKHNYKKRAENFQTAYTKQKPVEISAAELEIKPLTLEHLNIIYEHYSYYVSYDYLKRRLECSAIYGGFAEGELCGFVGTHEEGAIGILKVLEKFRRRGFAEALEGYMINTVLDRGEVPFVQVDPDNESSIKLQRKLGLEISKEMLYWLFD